MDDYTVTERCVLIWRSFPEVCRKIFATLLLSRFMCLLVSPLFSHLALIPKATMHLQVWNMLTYAWVDDSLLSVLFSGINLLLVGKMIEPVWGSTELLKFVGVVSLFTGMMLFLTCVICSFVFSSTWLIDYYCGFMGIIAAFTVALKQLMPEHELHIWFVPIRLKYLPSVVVLVVLVASLLFSDPRITVADESAGLTENVVTVHPVPQRAGSFLLVLCSIYVSWVYLRFFQSYLLTDSSVKGDFSESFRFRTFFPELFYPYVDAVSKPLYPVAMKLMGRTTATTTSQSSHRNLSDNFSPTETWVPPISDEEVRKKAAAAALQRVSTSAEDTA